MPVHMVLIMRGKITYLCNQAIWATPEKSTDDWSKVTCKNCLKIHRKKEEA